MLLSLPLSLAANAKIEANGAAGSNGLQNTNRISAGGGGAGGSILAAPFCPSMIPLVTELSLPPSIVFLLS